jgi:hypothetical protein
MTVVAVDWSGRRTGEQRFLWLAEAADGVLVRLEAGRTRAALVDELVALAADGAAPVVGLDFSFSLPAWFLDARGYAGAPELWAAAAVDGERWLQECPEPFWGLTGRKRPDGHEQFRVTESSLAAVGGIRPKSTFQIGGAGSVGTGSVRGFPALLRLRAAGFAIWPFDAPARPPVAIEIYPRSLTGAVVKSDPLARIAYLAAHVPDLEPGLRDRAIASEDAFDAAVSALVMSRHEAALRNLRALDEPVARREGWVWSPEGSAPPLTPTAPPVATG